MAQFLTVGQKRQWNKNNRRSKESQFTGITGQVRFDEKQRFKLNPKYTLAYYDGKTQNWTDVGTIQVNNVSYTSEEVICWPSPWGCGLSKIPPDSYVVPVNYLFYLFFIPMSLIVVFLLAYILFNKRRMTEIQKRLNEKDKIDQQLNAVTEEQERMKIMHANLLRRRKEVTDKPENWTETKDVLVPILPSDEEYWNVHSILQGKSEKMKDAWISKLWRIQNMHLWTLYSFHLGRLESLLEEPEPNEIMVWHGTGVMDPSIIYNDTQDGFLSQLSRKGKWGRGTYFASESFYSHPYAYQPHQNAQSDSPPNAGNEREMFLTKLSTG